MFADRTDAGKQLGDALKRYASRDTVVLAIPRGGAAVGYEVARALGARLSLIISRKLPLPWNPEAGFGAVSEDGSTWLAPGYESWLSPEEAGKIVDAQREEIARRIEVLRDGADLLEIGGKTVILVDDGIAMGSTMRASVAYCRSRDAGKVVVAAPVTGRDTARRMEEIADDVVVLETPRGFRAVAQAYLDWYDVPDEEVLAVMEKAREEGLTGGD